MNPRLRSHKLVVPAVLYHRRTRIPENWSSVIGDANYSVLVSGRTGCLAGHTKIITPQGCVTLRDCSVILQVYSYNFRRSRIDVKTAIKVYTGRKKTFEVLVDGESGIICTEDHRFFLKDTNQAVALKDLKIGDKIVRLRTSDPEKQGIITSITKLKDDDMTYDLKVADNHNFFLANGVLTHNSGKDSLTTFIMNLDSAYNRTVIVLDTKMEYPCAIFSQQDVVLRNLLVNKHRLVGRGYKTVLWIPYVEGLHKNEHFSELLTYHHPNLEVRPFRIRISDFASEDSYNMSLSKTELQSNTRSGKLVGQSKVLNEIREETGRRMGFDDYPMKEEGEETGWEYLDFEEITTNRKVNVVATFFMSKSSLTATSYMIGILNDFLTIGKCINRIRGADELFTIIIPEVEIILPRGVKNLDQIVNTLKFSMRMGLKLMRSFGVRLRMNLQNLSALDPDMVSQSVPFAGRTWNPKDLNMLSIFGLSRKDRLLVSRSAVGTFHDVIHGRSFEAVPFSHKAREREYFVTMMRKYYADPSLFLFETENYFLSEIVEFEPFFWEGKPLTVKEYNYRVKSWIALQKPRIIRPLDVDGMAAKNVLTAELDRLRGVA